MMFLAKKILAALLQPLTLSLVLLAFGLWLAWFSKWKMASKVILTGGFLILLFFSLTTTSYQLLSYLESQHLPLVSAPLQTQTIVVLGGGVGGDVRFPANTRINSASLSRLIEGVRLYKQFEKKGLQPQLILSGGRVFKSHSSTDSEDMQNIALVLGIPKNNLRLENGSKNTFEEARYLKKMLQNKPFILVTSASHMPRALAIFKKQGLQPIAAPTQFLSTKTSDPTKIYIPNTNALIFSDIALHEYFGILWERWRKEL